MTPQDALHQIVRSKPFQQASPQQRIEFVQGYLANQQPSTDQRAAFVQFDSRQQREIAEEAIRRVSVRTDAESAQHAVEVVGPMAGGLLGAQAGTPLGVPGMIVGGTAGAMIGEFAPELTRPFTTGKAADLAGALERSAETGVLSILTGPLEGAAAVGSRVFGGMRSRLFGLRNFKDPQTGKMIENPDVTAARSVLEPRGGGLTLGQQRGTGRGFFENISRNAISGEGRFADLDRANAEAIDAFADEVSARLGQAMPAEQLGTFISNYVAKGGKLARDAGSRLFRKVDEAAGGIQTIQDDALDFVDAISKLPGGKKVFASFNAGKSGGKKGLEELLGRTGNGFSPFADADLAASELKAVERELRKRGEVGAANIAGKLAAKVRDGVNTALDQLDPALREQADAARTFWKQEVADRYESTVMRSLVKRMQQTPGQLPVAILNGGIDTLQAVKAATSQPLRDAAGNITQRAAWPEIQKSVIGSILTRATDPVAGLFSNVRKISGQKLMQVLQSLDEGNTQFVRTLTDGTTTASDFRRLATAIDLANRKVSGSGGVFMRLQQSGEAVKAFQLVATGGAAASGGIGGAAAGAGAFIITPKLLANWFTNRQAMQNLADGLIGGPKSAAARRLITMAAAFSDESRGLLREEVGDVRPAVQQGAQSLRGLIQTQGLPPLTLDSGPTITAPATRPRTSL